MDVLVLNTKIAIKISKCKSAIYYVNATIKNEKNSSNETIKRSYYAIGGQICLRLISMNLAKKVSDLWLLNFHCLWEAKNIQAGLKAL